MILLLMRILYQLKNAMIKMLTLSGGLRNLLQAAFGQKLSLNNTNQ